MTDPVLSRITVYPIKSLDGVDVTSCACLTNGALAMDRRFAIQSADGRFLNAKRTANIHRLRADFDLDAPVVRLGDRVDGIVSDFPLRAGHEPLDRFLSDFFAQTVSLIEDDRGGFPDDTDAPGPTLVSEATLQTVAGWFDGLTVDETRRRFRANLEIADVEPFWEDRLYTADGGRPLQIGNASLVAVNPCQRCVVPTRSAETGDFTADFVNEFCRHRARTLPCGVAAGRFDHHYRLAVNTIGVADTNGRFVRTGDPITVQWDRSVPGY